MKKPKKWVQGAVKHPGALTAAAEKHGLTTKQEAEKETKSPNPKIAARGRLGKRFLGTAKRGNLRKGKRSAARKRA